MSGWRERMAEQEPAAQAARIGWYQQRHHCWDSWLDNPGGDGPASSEPSETGSSPTTRTTGGPMTSSTTKTSAPVPDGPSATPIGASETAKPTSTESGSRCGCLCWCHEDENAPWWPGPCGGCCEPGMDCACGRALTALGVVL